MATQLHENETVLVIRLGAMGDVLHALPAVASMKLSFPRCTLVWLIAQKWLPLLAGNPYVDEIVPFDRAGIGSFWDLRRALRAVQPEIAIDFQGLLQSALAGRLAGAKKFYGFDRTVAREPLSSMLYTDCISVTGPHRIQRNLELVTAAGATRLTEESWIPEGLSEGELPRGPYVLASPFAGWRSKEWVAERYGQLGKLLNKHGLELILNVPPERSEDLSRFQHARIHTSSLEGLIHATRCAAAVIGVDSGPLHLAAALKKPGVALYGPTDPAQTGPFNSPMIVVRQQEAETTYKRGRDIHESMDGIAVEQVSEALLSSIAAARV
ncbi:MAG: glycosyltransferase family 9 protein [Acidobacteriota bacterium]|nr:glycosyltransferase family 9 protein [Acidobacteriota bacterium]